MSKNKQEYVCENCGAKYAQWLGQCSNCKQWNTLVEQQIIQKETQVLFKNSGAVSGYLTPHELSKVPKISNSIISTNISELDRVLGNGLVAGSITLLTGEPGVGKSTLLLQLGINLAEQGTKTLYVSAEEIIQQIAARAERISKKPVGPDLHVVNGFSLEKILELIMKDYEVILIDSVQTIASEMVRGVPGGMAQVKYCTAELVSLAKQLNKTLILVGHINKEGTIAGPKMLEHLVDTVLYFGGDESSGLRQLRAFKNRFGSVEEIGIFVMGEAGLSEVKDPRLFFLGEEGKEGEEDKDSAGSSVLPSGVCRTVVIEGKRPIVVEVQALVTQTSFNLPKRVSEGFPLARLQMLIAVLQRSMNIKLYEYDIYLSVANGFKLNDRGADLAVLLAIVSSLKGVPVSNSFVAIGEVALSGKVQPSQWQERRIKEATSLGYTKQLTSKNCEHVSKINLPKGKK